MTNEFLSALKHLYGQAGVPAAVTDSDLNVLWRNSLADTHRCPLKKDDLSFIFENGVPVSGAVSIAEGETVHRLNVLAAEDSGDKSRLYIIEHFGSDDIKALLSAPQVRDYMTYLCARIRESAGMIAASSDEIDAAAAFSDPEEDMAGQLNTINRGLMLILREVISPEQLYYVLDPGCDNATISVETELSRAAADARRVMGKKVNVVCSTESGIFTRINRSVFETIISNMAAECCSGELFPEEMIFSAEKLSPTRAAVSVKTLNRSGKKNVPLKFELKGGSRLYSDYLCSVMCEKYGAEYTRKEEDGGCMCRIEINTVSSDTGLIMNRFGFFTDSERFSPMALALARNRVEERYKNINIDE